MLTPSVAGSFSLHTDPSAESSPLHRHAGKGGMEGGRKEGWEEGECKDHLINNAV